LKVPLSRPSAQDRAWCAFADDTIRADHAPPTNLGCHQDHHLEHLAAIMSLRLEEIVSSSPGPRPAGARIICRAGVFLCGAAPASKLPNSPQQVLQMPVFLGKTQF